MAVFGTGPLDAQVYARQRVSLDAGWRFTKGDPPELAANSLLYNARPVATGEDAQERAAESTSAAAQLATASRPVLKPWILPSGNAYVQNPAKRAVRPPNEPPVHPSYAEVGFDDSAWRTVNLPDDWAIAGPFNSEPVGGSMGRLPSPGVAWYRRRLKIPVNEAHRRISLQVDGAMSYAEVWLNGHLVGGWPYGYASWQLDLTRFLRPGQANLLAIRLDNPPDFSRWYPGAGLYRHVWLVNTAPVHIAPWGTAVSTPQVSPQSATVNLQAEIRNETAVPQTVELVTTIYVLDDNNRRSGNSVLTLRSAPSTISAGTQAKILQSATLAHPRLWGPVPLQKPNRYTALTEVRQQGHVLDQYETRFGIRKVEARPDGLYINGQRIRIQGVDMHSDLGALGMAFHLPAAERQVRELQEMGCNAIRMAHNPPAPELLDLLDRKGILVFDEIFDAWVRQKTPFDFHLIFPDWHEQDLRAFIRRDRNHPSVFVWSVGNEVGEQNTGDAGAAVARELVAIAHQEDPTRPVTASMNAAKPGSPFAAAMDLVSLNYQGEGIRDTPEYANFKGLKTLPQYDAFHEQYPGKLILSSESAATVSSRGTYLFPVAEGTSNPVEDGWGGDPVTHQVSGYELYAASFGSSPDKVFAAQDRHPYVAGEFVWSGWDYLGEPTPYYTSRSSYFGIIDLAGFKKDRFYLYQSRWRPDLPMAHILPHWTWPDRVGKVTPVHVFTSGDEAELFLNGRSLGRKKKGAFDYRLRWDNVLYEPGELKVVAYKNGVLWATDEVRTAATPAKLILGVDKTQLTKNGEDLAFITASVVDSHGVLVPEAANRIHFSVSGPGDLVATDNGDPTDIQVFSSHDRRAFHGKCLVIVRSRKGSGNELRVTATAEGNISGQVSIPMQKVK